MPCLVLVLKVSSHARSRPFGGVSEKKTHSDHVTLNSNEAYGQGNRRLSRSVQSFAIIKNAGHGNFVIGCFHTRAVCRRPLPHRHPFSDFFLLEEAAVPRLSETDNSYPNCPSKLTNKVRWIVHSKLKPFRFETKTYCLSDTIIKRITRLTRITRLPPGTRL